MKMDEGARKNERKIVFYISDSKRQHPNREKTLKPRPNYRVKTNKLHYVRHGNSGSLDNLQVS